MKSAFRILAGALLAMAGADLRAQAPVMERSVIAGGGGTSTGGALLLTGTIGQPDAGPTLTGGSFALTGGFWAVPAAVQMPGAPRLSIAFSGGLVVVSWPAADATGFVLDRRSTLNPGPFPAPWMQVPFPYQTNATHVFVTTPPDGTGYYRLRRQ